MHLVQLIVSACQVSKISEILALQGLLAVQVLLFGLRETRTAMHIGGLLTSMFSPLTCFSMTDLAFTEIAYEAGLHRCPNRFLQTFRTAEERDLRKRIFYSLYSLDRLLSAEFGIPLTMNDTDIDTCLPGDVEVHQVARSGPQYPAGQGESSMSIIHGRESHRDNQSRREDSRETVGSKRRLTGTDEESPHKRPRTDAAMNLETQIAPTSIPMTDPDAEASKNARLQPALTLTRMTRMVGVAMETFNKSLEHRNEQSEFVHRMSLGLGLRIDESDTTAGDEALSLRVNLDKWWNDIGLDLDDDVSRPLLCVPG